MMGIFSETAPALWAAGLPVIPLVRGEKRPFFAKWSHFCEVMPTQEEQAQWLDEFPDNNIGLPLGPASGLVAFDVDSLDGSVVALIESLLPPGGSWRRRGKKGFVTLFQFSGEKTWQIKDANDNMVCELLSTGRQVVLPPSIHPDTGEPYSANMPLLGALGLGAVPLPRNFESDLRAALTHHGLRLSIKGHSRSISWVPRGARDDAYVRRCGTLAYDILCGRIPLKDAIQQVANFPQDWTERVDGDDLDAGAGVRNLVKFVLNDVREKGKILPRGWDNGLSEEDKAALGLDFSRDEQEWDYRTLLDELKQDMDADKTGDNHMVLCRVLIKRIVRSPNLGEMEIENLLTYAEHLSAKKILLRTLRKELKAARQPPFKADSHGLIAKELKKVLVNVKFDAGRFWVWRGACWDALEDYEVKNQIIANFDTSALCKREGDYKALVGTFRDLVTEPIGDGEVHGVNFCNGFLTPQLELSEPTPGSGVTYYLPYRFISDFAGKAPRFFKFLGDAWGEDDDFAEKIQALREALCVTLFGRAWKYQQAFLLCGVGHSGKSVLLNIIQGLFPPDRVSALSPDQWDVSGQNKFSTAQLVGKVLNIGGELSESRNIDGQVFKQVVAGDMIKAENKGQDPFSFRPVCAHWFASNYSPRSRDISDGFMRRWQAFQFNKKFPETDRNINLAEDIIAEEREAIASWAVSIMPEVEERGHYTVIPSSQALMEEVLASNCAAYPFIQESGMVKVTHLMKTVGPDGSLTSEGIWGNDLYQLFLTYTSTILRARHVSYTEFVTQLKSLQGTMKFEVAMKKTDIGIRGHFITGLISTAANGGTRRSRSV